MRTNAYLWLLSLLCALAMAAGCDMFDRVSFLDDDGDVEADPQEARTLPPHVAGTIGEHAVLYGGGAASVQGYGLVIGLGTNGTDDVPPGLRKYFVEELLRRGMGSYRHETEELKPTVILEDTDTAVVLMGGVIPPGAPEGTRFDVFVSALPQTGTRSLDGGVVMPADMRLPTAGGRATAGPRGGTKVWAEAGGPVFVNPFIDATDPEEAPKLREGRIIGGGAVTRARPIRLTLRRPDYARADLMQKRINERFGGIEKVAFARNRSVVEIEVPPKYRHEYDYFLELVLHLPVRTSGASGELHAAEIAREIQKPDANHHELALVWEAMGRQVVPVVGSLYTSSSPHAAFYAARAGLRLGDRKAADVIIHFAQLDDSPLQIPAIEELGRHGRIYRAVGALRRLLDAENDRARVAAYESLAKLGDVTAVRRTRVADDFYVDEVASERDPMIYVTQTRMRKIVLFGRAMKIRTPIFFTMPDDALTVNAFEGEETAVVFRKIPRTGTFTPSLRLGTSVADFAARLGSPAVHGIDGKIQGLNMTYGQVVGALYRMCQGGDIPARFILQRLPEVSKIYSEMEPVEADEFVEDEQ